MNITITTSAKTDDEAYELLKLFGLPLRDKPIKQEIEEAAYWLKNHRSKNLNEK